MRSLASPGNLPLALEPDLLPPRVPPILVRAIADTDIARLHSLVPARRRRLFLRMGLTAGAVRRTRAIAYEGVDPQDARFGGTAAYGLRL